MARSRCTPTSCSTPRLLPPYLSYQRRARAPPAAPDLYCQRRERHPACCLLPKVPLAGGLAEVEAHLMPGCQPRVLLQVPAPPAEAPALLLTPLHHLATLLPPADPSTAPCQTVLHMSSPLEGSRVLLSQPLQAVPGQGPMPGLLSKVVYWTQF